GQLTLELVDCRSSGMKRCLGQKQPFAPYIREDVHTISQCPQRSKTRGAARRVSPESERILGVSTELMRMLPPDPMVRWNHEDKCNQTHPRVAHGCNLTGKGSKHREWVSDVVHHESVTPMVTRRITNGKVHGENRWTKRMLDPRANQRPTDE
ncbi:hypothetical protein ARALYDRAFT_481537, partial [Arabidopsis lyrata subsp. lyrata]